jgi:hypothetical protein
MVVLSVDQEENARVTLTLLCLDIGLPGLQDGE